MGVIFQDNFDAVSVPWNCTGATPAGWTSLSACAGPVTYDGTTHYGHEITSGGRTGNSLKVWRQGSDWIGSFSGLNYTLPLTTYRELYTRWYMKIPSDFDTVGNTNYFKFWRYNHGATDTTYFNWNADTTLSAEGLFQVAPSASAGWSTVLTNAQIPRDDQWHCHELRIKLNSTGNTDGIIQYWLDGVLKANITNANFYSVDADYFKSASFGNGNTATTSFQTPWRALEYDDYVLSTDYIGLGGLSPPTNLRIV